MDERDLLKVLSANIKQYRGYAKLSQAELAERVDISVNFLSDIETARKWASPTTLAKLASVFKVEAYELLKPDVVLPDGVPTLINKYTEDACSALGDIRDKYLAKLSKK